jgi:2-oxoglutarate ferredoxin oxidoreductase subunit beta
MVHNGTNWVGYKTLYTSTNAAGPIVSASAPTSASENDLWIHDSKDHTKAWLLTRFFDDPKVAGHFPRPFGVFYQQERSTYEKSMQEQVNQAVDKFGEGDLDVLLAGRNNWEI